MAKREKESFCKRKKEKGVTETEIKMRASSLVISKRCDYLNKLTSFEMQLRGNCVTFVRWPWWWSSG